MVPINKRLSTQEKEEYLRLVIGLRKRWKNYDNAIHDFCKIIREDIELQKNDDLINSDCEEYRKYPNVCNWLLLSFSDIKQINYIAKKRKHYDSYMQFVEKVNIFKNTYKQFSSNSINKWIIKTSNVKICPYCNLAFVFNRENKDNNTMGQLDHFFPESVYPEFAISYYNLVPSCPTCNRIKSATTGTFISPYEDNAYASLKIVANSNKRLNYLNLKESEENINIEIVSNRKEEMDSVKQLGLNDTYGQLKDYAAEVLKKRIIYKNKYSRELIINAVKKAGLTDEEILRFYLGNYTNEESGMRILDKMTSDLFYEGSKDSGSFTKKL